MPRLVPFYPINPEQWLLETPNLGSSDLRSALRQWVLHELIRSYHYPKQWLGQQIVLTGPDQPHSNAGQLFGLCLLTQQHQPFLCIAIAPPGELALVEHQLIAKLLSSPYAGTGMVTDGSIQGSKFLRRCFDRPHCDYIADLAVYNPPPPPPPLTLLSERVESVFFEIHSHLRDIDGLHSDESLDELCKLLLVKRYDEAASTNGASPLQQRYGSIDEFAVVIRSLYDRACDQMLSGHASSLRLSSPALVRALQTLQPYDLSRSPADMRGRAFQKVIKPVIRAGMGQYFTPDPVVRFMVDMAAPQAGERVLDPFCGSAHFLTTCRDYLGQTAPLDLYGIEKSDRMVRIALTSLWLQGHHQSQITCADALLDFANYPHLPPASFDLILTNPPFGSLLGAGAIAQIGASQLAQGRKTCPLEILGLERCVQFLKPGGRLGIVLPDGILANQNTQFVRTWLQQQLKLRAVISLPIDTFTPFGAHIKTSIVFLRKWLANEPQPANYRIFLARIDQLGYDGAGRATGQVEFEPVGQQWQTFLAQEGW